MNSSLLELKILLVEDDDVDSQILRRVLSKSDLCHFQIKHEKNLTNSLEAIDSFKPDLIVTDLHLPDSDGLATFRSLKKHCPKTAIVILSGDADSKTAIEAVRQGAQDFVAKKNLDNTLLPQLLIHSYERKEHQKQLSEERRLLEQSSQLAALGEMAGGIAHEINNPLAIIVGMIEKGQRSMEKNEADTDTMQLIFSRVETATQRICDIVNGMRLVARNGLGDEYQTCTLAELIRLVNGLCTDKFKHQNIPLQTNIGYKEEIECNLTQISQVVFNLVSNAYHAVMEYKEPWVKIDVSLCPQSEDKMVQIRVIDSGKGIPPKILEKIFHPFFSTKEVGSGMGLGLSISKRMAEIHGGRLYCDNTQENTTMVLELPVQQNRSTCAA